MILLLTRCFPFSLCVALAPAHGNRSDEMNPGWFSLSEDSLYARGAVSSTDLPHIPYDQMWADDIHWLSHLVRGGRFVGRADLDERNVMRRYWFGSVSEAADTGDQVQ